MVAQTDRRTDGRAHRHVYVRMGEQADEQTDARLFVCLFVYYVMYLHFEGSTTRGGQTV